MDFIHSPAVEENKFPDGGVIMSGILFSGARLFDGQRPELMDDMHVLVEGETGGLNI